MSITRRKFLRYSGAAGAAAVTGYSLWEARDLHIAKFDLPLTRLPEAFNGLKIAFLADLHLGPFISQEYLRSVIDKVNGLGSDLILLGGDYVYREAKYMAAVASEMGRLTAPMGVFAVRGNHDNKANATLTSHELKRNGIQEITNTGVWLIRDDSRLRLCGVDDLQTGKPDLQAALGDMIEEETALLMTHNPDFAETITDSRVGLVLSGHTHGGQVCLPFVGAPIVPSQYGQKYVYGPVTAPYTKVFVTRGVGAVFPPVRLNCPPEIALLTLVA